MCYFRISNLNVSVICILYKYLLTHKVTNKKMNESASSIDPDEAPQNELPYPDLQSLNVHVVFEFLVCYSVGESFFF